MVLLASYFLTTLARLDKGLEPVARFSPIYYYQSGEAIEGLNGRWLTGLLAAAGLFTALRVVVLRAPGHPRRRRGGLRVAAAASAPTCMTSPTYCAMKRPVTPRRGSPESAENGEAIVIGCA